MSLCGLLAEAGVGTGQGGMTAGFCSSLLPAAVPVWVCWGWQRASPGFKMSSKNPGVLEDKQPLHAPVAGVPGFVISLDPSESFSCLHLLGGLRKRKSPEKVKQP